MLLVFVSYEDEHATTYRVNGEHVFQRLLRAVETIVSPESILDESVPVFAVPVRVRIR